MKQRNLKWQGILLIAVLISSVAAASVLALYMRSTDKVENAFTPAISEHPVIVEKFEQRLKENVRISITDKGYPVYVRCAIVVNWKDADGNVHSELPVENSDYTMEMGDDWTKRDDGFYYYQFPIQKGETSPLMKQCEFVGTPPNSNYTLSVNIISQTIQAVGTTDDGNIPACEDAWSQAMGE